MRRRYSSSMPPRLASAQILLNSTSEANPRGLANGSDQVGRNIMDHLYGLVTVAMFPGPLDSYYKGRRPTGLYIPRFRNVTEDAAGLRARLWLSGGHFSHRMETDGASAGRRRC